MDDFLQEKFSIEDISKARLTFFQKATLLPSNKSAVAFVKPGILELNSIRNKYGHKIDHKIMKSEMKEIYGVLQISRPDTKFKTHVDAIEAFAATACAFLGLVPKNIEEAFKGAMKHIRFV